MPTPRLPLTDLKDAAHGMQLSAEGHFLSVYFSSVLVHAAMSVQLSCKWH